MQEGKEQKDFNVYSIFVCDCGPGQARQDKANKIPSKQQVQNSMDWQINRRGPQKGIRGSRWLHNRDFKAWRRGGLKNRERNFRTLWRGLRLKRRDWDARIQWRSSSREERNVLCFWFGRVGNDLKWTEFGD